MIKYFNVNGQIVPKEKALIQVQDIAILRGYGVFDYFYVQNGRALFFDDYINRFEASANLLNIDLPFFKNTLKEYIIDLIEANGLKNAAIRLVLTGGYAIDGFTPMQSNLLILEHQQAVYHPEKYSKGIRLISHLYQREIPEAKTINYLTGIILLKKLKQAKAFDVLYHDGQQISESARSNFFIITKNDVIVTPNKGILKGITRKQLLKIAKKHYKVEERPLALAELETAKEAFLCSTTKGAMPVVQIDGTIIGNGKAGVIVQHLNQLFEERKEEYLTQMV